MEQPATTSKANQEPNNNKKRGRPKACEAQPKKDESEKKTETRAGNSTYIKGTKEHEMMQKNNNKASSWWRANKKFIDDTREKNNRKLAKVIEMIQEKNKELDKLCKPIK